MKLSTSLLASLAPAAMGHYLFWQTIVNGAKSTQWQYIRETANNPSSAPVEDVSSPLMACYEKSGRAAAAVQTVSSGSRVGFTASSSMGHPGPMLFYMARVPDGQDVNSWSPSGNVWFKIDQYGAKSGSQFETNMVEVYTTIPASLKAGNYLLRAEHVGLHIAGAPQFYIGCAQLKVTGNGASSPTSLVSFPGAYSKSDPGLAINIYAGAPATYPYPGPAVWGGGGSGGGGGGGGGGSTPTQTQTTQQPPQQTTPTTNPPPTGNCSSLYGQCGGQGYTGPTCCSSGTCKVSNQYYSQCL